MTDREKIISLAIECGLAVDGSLVIEPTKLKAFYHAAQKEEFERAALACDAVVSKLHGVNGLTSAYSSAYRQLIKE